MVVELNNGWFGVMADNMRGNTRMVDVDGLYREIGSVYSHDIVKVFPTKVRLGDNIDAYKGDDDYGQARLCQMIGNTIGTTLSMGVGRASRMDDSDNGTYLVATDWTIWESMNTPPLRDEKAVELNMTEIRAKNDQFFKDTGYPYK